MSNECELLDACLTVALRDYKRDLEIGGPRKKNKIDVYRNNASRKLLSAISYLEKMNKVHLSPRLKALKQLIRDGLVEGNTDDLIYYFVNRLEDFDKHDEFVLSKNGSHFLPKVTLKPKKKVSKQIFLLTYQSSIQKQSKIKPPKVKEPKEKKDAIEFIRTMIRIATARDKKPYSHIVSDAKAVHGIAEEKYGRRSTPFASLLKKGPEFWRKVGATNEQIDKLGTY